MPHLTPRQQAMALAAAAMAAALLLYCFPPSRYPFYAACPIHQMFGVSCPGCGGTRAVAALLAGRWAEALTQNALVVFLVPLAVILAAFEAYSVARWNRWHPVCVPAFAVHFLAAAALFFALARNLMPWLR
jgi:hypothetical protein